MSGKPPAEKGGRDWWRLSKRAWIWIGASFAAFLLMGPLFWFHVTNPYAGWNVVRQPYTTSVNNGRITVQKHFDLHVYSGGLASAVGYYKSGFLIVQNTLFGSKPVAASSVSDIARDLHRERFDPSKPYLISGDQFSVLYPRNLGIFYSSLLDPYTADSQKDWENRQRIDLQSVLYALDAFSKAKTLATTVVPVGARSVVLTEVHPGSVPSDTLYGMLFALDLLQDQSPYPEAPYKLEAVDAVHQILRQRRDDLQIYRRQVQDSQTGLVKRGVSISGARDGVVRDSSFYDNVILWKTLQLADKLGIQRTPANQLATLRDTILKTYWDNGEGHFKDDLSSRPAKQNYSSDWLVAITTGFLNAADPIDRSYLTRTRDFIRAQEIVSPFPIKYEAQPTTERIPWAVHFFLPNYGANIVWSYWGCQYIAMLNELYAATHNAAYDQEAASDIAIYASKITENHGFPETFDASGKLFQSGIYKSILRNGWIVEFESVSMQSKRLAQ